MTGVHNELALQSLTGLDRVHEFVEGSSKSRQLIGAGLVETLTHIGGFGDSFNVVGHPLQGGKGRVGGEVAQERGQQDAEQADDQQRVREGRELVVLTSHVRGEYLGRILGDDAFARGAGHFGATRHWHGVLAKRGATNIHR